MAILPSSNICQLALDRRKRGGDHRRMKPLKALKAARKAKKLSQEVVASEIGVSTSQLSRFETGKREPRAIDIVKAARLLEISVSSILEENPDLIRSFVRIVGKIGAGAEVIPDGDQDDFTEGDLAGEDCEAFVVSGSSMHPVAREGDMLFFGPPRPPAELMNAECIVELEDGRRFFKVLRYGSAPGLFTLDSYNQEPIVDAKVQAAGPLLAIRRRH